jgi:hypothetical protein
MIYTNGTQYFKVSFTTRKYAICKEIDPFTDNVIDNDLKRFKRVKRWFKTRYLTHGSMVLYKRRNNK